MTHLKSRKGRMARIVMDRVPKEASRRVERYRKGFSRSQTGVPESRKVPQRHLSFPNECPGKPQGPARSSLVPKRVSRRVKRSRKSVSRSQTGVPESRKVPQRAVSCPKGYLLSENSENGRATETGNFPLSKSKVSIQASFFKRPFHTLTGLFFSEKIIFNRFSDIKRFGFIISWNHKL